MSPLRTAITDANSRLADVRKEIKDNKPTDEQRASEDAIVAEIDKARKEQEEIVGGFAAGKPVIKQMIDLALLANGLLRGKELADFISRSVKML